MDRRILKVEVDHAQSRLKRPSINFTLRGWDFIDGTLEGCFVSPITGKLQPIPNSEEPDFQTSDSGRFRKIKLADGATLDLNTPAGTFETFGPDHAGQGIRYVGDNTAGIGFTTTAAWAQNTGATILAYAYSQGTDQSGVLVETYWANDASLTGGGVGFKFYQDGRADIFKDSPSQPVYKGSFTGGGYTPGTVRGGSYARATDEYVAFRIEAAGQFIMITSSRGGVIQFKAPWGIDRYKDDGTLDEAAEPLLPPKKWGWYVPKGSASIIAAPVIYGFTSPYAISKSYSLAEVPTYVGPSGVDVLFGRVLPFSPDVTVQLVKPDGVTPYDRTAKEFRAKVNFSGVAFVSGVVGGYPRIATDTSVPSGGPFDISDYVLSVSPFAVEDGPDGAGCDLILRGDCPVAYIDEVELRPFRFSLIPSPDDEDPQPALVLLDGVGDPPQWVDGFEPASQSIHIRVWDRMRLVREAKFRESVVWDGLPLCCPPSDGMSLAGSTLREGGLRDAELVDLPRIENQDGSLFTIDDTPAQIVGQWNLSAKARQLFEDILIQGMEMAPNYMWGLRPKVAGTRAYAVPIDGAESPVVTFYRSLATAATDPSYEINELGAWPLLYGEGHHRDKLPKEGNVVRVVGRDPGTGEYISAFIRDNASADPESPIGPDKLGVPREVFRRIAALTTQAAVNAVTRSLAAAVAQRAYSHGWPAFMRFLLDGSPIWRGDRVRIEKGLKDGTDATVRLSALSVSLVDENGGGLMDEDGNLAPVSIRLTDYSGGAICGNGGTNAWDIASRQRMQVADGGKTIGVLSDDFTGMGRANDLS